MKQLPQRRMSHELRALAHRLDDIHRKYRKATGLRQSWQQTLWAVGLAATNKR